MSLCPDWDIDLGPGQGLVNDQLEAFLEGSSLTNQQRRKALEKYPLPAIAELRPPKLDMTLKIHVSKPVSAHDVPGYRNFRLCVWTPMLPCWPWLLNEQASGRGVVLDCKMLFEAYGQCFCLVDKRRFS